MTKIIEVEGMKCEHCEAHVEEALKAVDGVTGVKADRVSKTAKVELSKDVPDDVLLKAVNEHTRYQAKAVRHE